jgi:hypothetical protein
MQVVILVKAFDVVGGVSWSTQLFTLGPKVSTTGETVTLAKDLHSSVDATKPFSDISEKLTALFLVLENAIENKESCMCPTFHRLSSL